MKLVVLLLCTIASQADQHQWNLSSWDADCGRSLYPDAGVERGQHIVGGIDARPGEYPWQALVLRNGSPFCAGVIINPKWILTGASCVTGDNTYVNIAVGEYDRSALSTFRQIHEIYAIIIHEDYGEAARFDASIALIAMTTKITYNERVQPICPPQAGNSYTGSTATISGWGSLWSEGATAIVQQWINLPIPTNEECQQGRPNDDITSGMICAGSPFGNDKRPCWADTGAPLAVKNSDDRFELAGFVSWVFGCTPEPAIATRVSEYLDWIDSKILGYEL